MDQLAIKQYVEQNSKMVSMRECANYPGLFVLKYKKSVFFNDTWNEFLEECRGTVVNAEFNVVARPFTKVYNYAIESRAPVLDANTNVTAYRKVNGFMVSVTWYAGDVLVSTTGSTDSPYVAMAKEMMLKHMSWADWQIAVMAAEGTTLLFECVHPQDPHIIVEQPGMYFLGYRENTWDSVVKMYGQDVADWAREYAMSVLNCYYAEPTIMTVGEMLDRVKTAQHEGYVFYTADNVCAKIKSPFYLTQKWVARNPRTDKLMKPGFKQQIDEEYYPLVDAIRANITEYTAMDEQARLGWVRKFLGVV